MSGVEEDSFLLHYNAKERRIASEFLTNWLPFLSKDLCSGCTQTLSDRVRFIHPGNAAKPLRKEESLSVLGGSNVDMDGCADDHDHDNDGTKSIERWKDGANGLMKVADESSSSMGSDRIGVSTTPVESTKVRMSWADMAQEDELEVDEDSEMVTRATNGHASSRESIGAVAKVSSKPVLSREQREYIRFTNVKRNKDFICFERIKGKLVNILEGLELHTGIFSAVEQKRIVDFVYELQEQGKNGKLKDHTYTAPRKWMRGKGRVTIQFGCYNYAHDKNGNPPGILQNEGVDTIPYLFKVIIRRLVKWHVLPPTCVPDSCIVNIYDEGDCIPPHIDNHDFLRPFCTVSFLSQCDIVFGSALKVIGEGEFNGPSPISLPVGISITFRKMDESKWPIGFVPEPDLQGLQPFPYEDDKSKRSNPLKSNLPEDVQATKGEDNRGNAKRAGMLGPGPRFLGQIREGPLNRRRVRLNLEE